MCPGYIKLIQIVGRLRFGAFSPARRAPEVRFDVSLLHQIHSDSRAAAS